MRQAWGMMFNEQDSSKADIHRYEWHFCVIICFQICLWIDFDGTNWPENRENMKISDQLMEEMLCKKVLNWNDMKFHPWSMIHWSMVHARCNQPGHGQQDAFLFHTQFRSCKKRHQFNFCMFHASCRMTVWSILIVFLVHENLFFTFFFVVNNNKIIEQS